MSEIELDFSSISKPGASCIYTYNVDVLIGLFSLPQTLIWSIFVSSHCIFCVSDGFHALNGKWKTDNGEQGAKGRDSILYTILSASIYNKFVCLFWTWIRIEAPHFHKSFSLPGIANGFEIQWNFRQMEFTLIRWRFGFQ